MLTVPLKLCVALMLVVLSSVSELQAQTAPDTARTGLLQMYWTKQRFVPKIGGSIQERALFELGVQWHNIYRHPLSLASKGPYAMIDVMINDDNLLLGPKLGYEFTAGLFGLAFDVTYYIDRDFDREGNDRRAFVGTPKGGLTVLGFLDFYYGYQIPFSEQRITSLSRHRFSIIFTLNKDYFDIKNAPRRG